MNNIVTTIIRIIQNLSDNDGEKIVVSEETKLSRDNGFDSLGIVTLIVNIEDDLSIELDDYLLDIRKDISVSDLIEIVSRAYNEQNK